MAATTVEPGPGIKSDHASIYLSRDAFHWHESARFRKDIYRPLKLFKYGVISFPSGTQPAGKLVFSGEGLCGIDGRVMQATFTQEARNAIHDATPGAGRGSDRPMVA